MPRRDLTSVQPGRASFVNRLSVAGMLTARRRHPLELLTSTGTYTVSVARSSIRRAPTFITPMAARLVETLPEGDGWLYEVKWDGYRALLIKDHADVQIRSRNDKDLTRMYPAVAAALARIEPKQVTLDGEIVALAADGRPSFQALQHRSSHASHQIVYYAFDVLHLEGRDLTGDPLTARRAHLPAIIRDGKVLRISHDLPGRAADVTQAVRSSGIEGVIAKRRDSSYQAGERSNDWVKLKLDRQQEFVIGGYRPDGATNIDALLVGVYEGRELLFAGKVRSGFTPHIRREVVARLKPIRTAACPFANLPDEKHGRWGSGVTAEDMREMQWCRPEVVVQIRFVEWTAEGRLRHAVYLGLREDKAALNVRREA